MTTEKIQQLYDRSPELFDRPGKDYTREQLQPFQDLVDADSRIDEDGLLGYLDRHQGATADDVRKVIETYPSLAEHEGLLKNPNLENERN